MTAIGDLGIRTKRRTSVFDGARLRSSWVLSHQPGRLLEFRDLSFFLLGCVPHHGQSLAGNSGKFRRRRATATATCRSHTHQPRTVLSTRRRVPHLQLSIIAVVRLFLCECETPVLHQKSSGACLCSSFRFLIPLGPVAATRLS